MHGERQGPPLPGTFHCAQLAQGSHACPSLSQKQPRDAHTKVTRSHGNAQEHRTLVGARVQHSPVEEPRSAARCAQRCPASHRSHPPTGTSSWSVVASVGTLCPYTSASPSGGPSEPTRPTCLALWGSKRRHSRGNDLPGPHCRLAAQPGPRPAGRVLRAPAHPQPPGREQLLRDESPQSVPTAPGRALMGGRSLGDREAPPWTPFAFCPDTLLCPPSAGRRRGSSSAPGPWVTDHSDAPPPLPCAPGVGAGRREPGEEGAGRSAWVGGQLRESGRLGHPQPDPR